MGFENDLLGREKYADFLSELINNPEKYKRNSDSESMCIAIDSGWGTGKTTFINMWKEKMEDNDSKSIVIKYDAWKNDFSENPLESIVYTILLHKFFYIENEKAAGKENFKNILECTGKIVNLMVKSKIKSIVGEDIEEVASEIKDIVLEGVKSSSENSQELNVNFKDFYEEYERYYTAVEDLKKILVEIAKDRKVIILIDELDRCKPIFAIKLLESIKHILDSKGVTFVFALDLEQLGHSVKSVYGQEMDANGYLCRFFDYISKMPIPDKKSFINYLIAKNPLNVNSFTIIRESDIFYFKDILYKFAIDFDLSLRDIETIYTNFRVFENLRLNKVTSCFAYSLYLFLIILKYKRIDIYNEVFLEKRKIKLEQSVFSKYTSGYVKFFSINVIDFIINSKNIKEISFSFKGYTETLTGKLYKYENRQLRCLRDDNGFWITCNSNTTASEVLFLDDFERIEEIKDRNLAEYIQEKLEFFDFEYLEMEENQDNSLKEITVQ